MIASKKQQGFFLAVFGLKMQKDGTNRPFQLTFSRTTSGSLLSVIHSL